MVDMLLRHPVTHLDIGKSCDTKEKFTASPDADQLHLAVGSRPVPVRRIRAPNRQQNPPYQSTTAPGVANSSYKYV